MVQNKEGGIGHFIDPDDAEDGVGVIPVLENDIIDAVSTAVRHLVAGFNSFVKGHVPKVIITRV